jgi:uncharacterized membrane protein YphA (DoxX/SURF4 family)
MNVVAWTLSAVCAVAFLSSGTVKSVMSKQRMIESGQTGVAPFPLPIIRIVAASEIVAVAGLILPPATGIAEYLTPVAACWLAVVMVGAAISHASIDEYKQVLYVNTPLFSALTTIAVLRIVLL